jgi:hypothetical protein
VTELVQHDALEVDLVERRIVRARVPVLAGAAREVAAIGAAYARGGRGAGAAALR